MAGSMRGTVCGLLAGLLGWCICGTSPAQDVPARPEVVPAPPPRGVPRQALPQPTYDPLQAAHDAYRAVAGYGVRTYPPPPAEQQRLQAIERQLQLVQSAWQYRAWPAPYYAPGVPYVYGYGYAYGPRRLVRRAYRYGYWAAPQPWPYPTGAVYAYPYSTWTTQPYGSVYRPYYGQPTQGPNVPTPSPTPARPQQPPTAAPPAEEPSGPALKRPIQPAPESIPTPTAEPAP